MVLPPSLYLIVNLVRDRIGPDKIARAVHGSGRLSKGAEGVVAVRFALLLVAEIRKPDRAVTVDDRAVADCSGHAHIDRLIDVDYALTRDVVSENTSYEVMRRVKIRSAVSAALRAGNGRLRLVYAALALAVFAGLLNVTAYIAVTEIGNASEGAVELVV